MTVGSYPDFPQLCAWGWIGTLCAGEHRENCGCPGTPSFTHRPGCRCYEPPAYREWHETECPMCSGSGRVQDFSRGPVAPA